MIYFFSGDDVKNKNISFEDFIESHSKDVEIFFVETNNFNKYEVENFLQGQGLFAHKCLVVFVDILEDEENRKFILSLMPKMKDSQNDFVFKDNKDTKEVIDSFKKNNAKINFFNLDSKEKEKFNNFLLADAFGERNKLNLWIYFRQAVEKGVGLEELVGVLFWKAKDMILRNNFRKFSEVELREFLLKISYILPEARKNGLDDEACLEMFLIESM